MNVWYVGLGERVKGKGWVYFLVVTQMFYQGHFIQSKIQNKGKTI